MSNLYAGQAAVHEHTPPDSYVGQRGYEERHGQWSMHAFDTTETPIAGSRSGEWTAVGRSELSWLTRYRRPYTPEGWGYEARQLAGVRAARGIGDSSCSADDPIRGPTANEPWCIGLVDFVDTETRLDLQGEVRDLVHDGCIAYPAAVPPTNEQWCVGLVDFLDAQTRLNLQGEVRAVR